MKKIINIYTKALIFTFFTLISLFLNVEALITNIKNPFIIGAFELLLIGVLIYKMYFNYYSKNNKSNNFKFMATIFSLFTIIGDTFNKTNSFDLMFISIPIFLLTIIRFIGYFILFNLLINKLFDITSHKIFENHNKFKKLDFVFNKHPFLSSLLIMLICWLPYIIAFYPAILSPDPSNQIKQYFNIKTHYNESVVMLDENVLITNHHPVFHTLLLGGSVYLGKMSGSVNLGLFIYSIIQITILISTLAFTIKYMKKLNTPLWLRLCTLIFYALVPVFPLYAMSAVKDTIFGSLIILYIIFIFDLIKYQNLSIKKCIYVSVLIFTIMLFRNNGYHVIIISMPFIILSNKKFSLKLLCIFLIPIIIYKGYTNILLPNLHITKGSIREMLSVPFQQTARYFKKYEDELSNNDKKVIDKILDTSDLKERYNPTFADPVKNKFNKYTTNNDLKEYFNVWMKGLFKHPITYVESTLNNTFGYYYPNTYRWYIYYKYDSRLKDSGFNYHYNHLKNMRNILSSYGVIFPYIPILGLTINIGFNTWIIILMTGYIIALKKYRYLNYLIPSIILVLVCIASPVNTYFRYALPYVFAMPIMISMFINIKKEME